MVNLLIQPVPLFNYKKDLTTDNKVLLNGVMLSTKFLQTRKKDPEVVRKEKLGCSLRSQPQFGPPGFAVYVDIIRVGVRVRSKKFDTIAIYWGWEKSQFGAFWVRNFLVRPNTTRVMSSISEHVLKSSAIKLAVN